LRWSGILQIVFTAQIALKEDGYNVLFCVYKQPAEQAVTWEISTCCSINKQGNNRSLQEEEIFRKGYE